jgi:magnesium-transporting ATPase (P-type)
LLFPIYRLVLKWAPLYQAAGWLLVWIGFALLGRIHAAADPGAAVAGDLKSLWLVGVNTFAAITATFALIERYHAKSRFLEQWNPRKLPRLRHPNQISRSNSAAELAWNGLLILWWLNLLRLPEVPGLRVALAPALSHSFYWLILTLFVALASIACANLFRPWWTRRRAGIRIAINSFGLILVALLFMTKPWFEVIAPHATTTEAHDIAQWVDGTAAVLLLFYAMSFALRGLQDIRRVTGKEPIRHWAMRMLAGE